MKIGASALLFAVPMWASYSYYLTDSLASVDPLKWAVVGSVAPGSNGLAAVDPAGGSLISRLPIPDGTAEAEVRITIWLTSE